MKFGKAKREDVAPWDADAEPVVPPGVIVTVCPPSPVPTGRPALPRDEPGWSADDGDFFSDGGGVCDA
jgi:hypothetical protein